MLKTFEKEEELPNLPLPDLDSTVSLYLDSVKALSIDEDAFTTTTELVKDPKLNLLHDELVRRSQEKKNWLEDYWLEYAYLKNRESLTFSSNFAGNWITADSALLTAFKVDLRPESSLRSRATAALLYQVCQCWLALRNQKLPPFIDGKGKRYSMNQFRYFFNTSRLPQKDSDIIDTHFKPSEEGPCPQHIVVLYRGRFYTFTPFIENGNKVCSEYLIEQALIEIENQGQGVEDEKHSGIGALSANDRDTWSQHFQLLKQTNSEAMETISSAICLVVLSDLQPVNHSQQLKWTFINDGSDIWADKSLTFMAFGNGTIGSHSDHSPFDGMVSAEVCAFCLKALAAWTPPSQIDTSGSIVVKPIQLDVPPSILEAIPKAQADILAKAKDLCFDYHEFPQFGKARLKKLMIHPDAFVQVVIQAAVYMTHQRGLATYETATTRQFYHGRTETVRSCTKEAMVFAEALVAGDKGDEELRHLFKAAIEKHLHLMEQCKVAQGCDRHLLGMKILAVEKGQTLPALYEDKSYTLSGGDGNYLISTSLCGFTKITGGCSPMVKDGYGIFYGIPNDSIALWINTYESSKFSNGALMLENLFDAFEKTERLFQ